MRNLVLAAATAAAIAFSIGSAEAFPVAPASGLAASADLTLVSGGCGPYGHRGPYGGCRPGGFPGRPFGYGYGYGFHRRFYGFHRPYGYGYGFHRRFY